MGLDRGGGGDVERGAFMHDRMLTEHTQVTCSPFPWHRDVKPVSCSHRRRSTLGMLGSRLWMGMHVTWAWATTYQSSPWNQSDKKKNNTDTPPGLRKAESDGSTTTRATFGGDKTYEPGVSCSPNCQRRLESAWGGWARKEREREKLGQEESQSHFLGIGTVGESNNRLCPCSIIIQETESGTDCRQAAQSTGSRTKKK